MSLDIVLRGSDKLEKTFIEKTRTVNISRTGTKAMTEHALSHGARLQVAVPNLKRSSWATVAWVGNKTGNLQEIGIAVDETNDFWGVQLPEEMQGARSAGTLPELGETELSTVSPAGGQQSLTSTDLKHEIPSAVPQPEHENSDRLSKLLQELAQRAIEHSLGEALQQVNQHATEIRSMHEAITKQTEAHLRRSVEAALQQVEAAALEITNRSKHACEQGIQSFADSAREQLRTQSTEHQTDLAASAAKVRRELGRKFSDLSSAFDEE